MARNSSRIDSACGFTNAYYTIEKNQASPSNRNLCSLRPALDRTGFRAGNPSTQASAATGTAVGNTVITQSGPPLPVFDPTLFGNTSWAHQTVPESSTFIAGTDNNTSTTGHSAGTLFNRAPSASLGLTVTQHVLQGFSLAVNQRQIQIANTNREPSDLTFKL